MTDKRIIIIAGPNGAGKTTFAQEYLPNEADCPVFINADLIAAGLSSLRPAIASLRAGRLMLQEINNHVREEKSFAFETTLAGCSYSRKIDAWRIDGYSVKLIFLSLKGIEESIARVKLRVRQGGHSIPEPIIRRRFYRGFLNFYSAYRYFVDDWHWYDNSDVKPILLDENSNEKAL